jgi:predicted nucleotidyltransferase
MRDLNRDELLAALRTLRPEMEREGIEHVGLFGSRARGDYRPDSDVDLLIDVVENRKFSLLDAAGIYGMIEDKVGLPSSVVVRDKFLPKRFLDSVNADLISVF